MLLGLGVRTIHEESDGVATIEAIRTLNPDILLINWSLSVLDGCDVIGIIRHLDFPKPEIPIILMTDNSTVSRITEALEIGVHEILLKPFSPRALEQRLRTVVTVQRPMVRMKGRYVPQARTDASCQIDLQAISRAKVTA